jgi:hypothetical protein
VRRLGPSGKDIALDLGRVAREVHLAASSEAEGTTPAMSRLLANHGDVLRLHPRVHTDGQVEFTDGSSVMADTVIYCTGYAYSFPFLDTGGAVTVSDDGYVVGPLFVCANFAICLCEERRNFICTSPCVANYDNTWMTVIVVC